MIGLTRSISEMVTAFERVGVAAHGVIKSMNSLQDAFIPLIKSQTNLSDSIKGILKRKEWFDTLPSIYVSPDDLYPLGRKCDGCDEVFSLGLSETSKFKWVETHYKCKLKVVEDEKVDETVIKWLNEDS